MDEILGLKVSLEEMKSYSHEQNGTMDSLKATARSIFQGSSLILALIGALQIWNAKVLPAYKGLYDIGVLLVLLIYLILIVMCINSLLPSTWFWPINTKWETLYDAFMEKEEVDVIKAQLSDYLNVIALNDKVLEKAVRIIKWEGSLLGALVVLLLGMSILPR